MDKRETVPGGLLVVVEGVDGAGKSSVIRRLAEYCEAKCRAYVMSREPTEGVWGKKIRASAITGRLGLVEELELFMRDRKEHVEGLILPELGRGKVVILDRYYFSSAAYQGARGADPEAVLAANEAFAPKPDLVLLLDCSPEVSLERIRKRGGVPDEFEALDALATVRGIFRSIERPFIRVVDASASAEEVGAVCVEYVEAAWLAKG